VHTLEKTVQVSHAQSNGQAGPKDQDGRSTSRRSAINNGLKFPTKLSKPQVRPHSAQPNRRGTGGLIGQDSPRPGRVGGDGHAGGFPDMTGGGVATFLIRQVLPPACPSCQEQSFLPAHPSCQEEMLTTSCPGWGAGWPIKSPVGQLLGKAR
jgi:hypothetical protein